MNTEISLPVPELKQALNGLNKLIGRKTTLPVLSHVRVTRKADGLVQLQGTDLDAHATYTLNNAQAGAVVDLLVPLEQLNKACKCSGTTDPVTLVCEGKDTKLRYYLGGCPLSLPVNTLPVDEWPPIPTITADASPLPPGFGETLKQAMACCSDNPARQVLHGACLDARDAEGHYIVGTNGSFLFSANSFNFPLKDAIIVPDSKFLNGSSMLDEPCSLAIQPAKKPSEMKHICLTTKQWQFVTREIMGQYPNWKQVVPASISGWTLVKLSPPAMEQLLKVLPNLPGYDGINNTVKLSTGNKAIWVAGRNKDDKEWTKLAIEDVTITGPSREINLNREYLLPALRFGLDELAIFDELTPLVASKAGKKMIIMPVRPCGPPIEKTATPPASVPPTAEVPQPAEEKETTMAKDKPEEAKPEPASPSLLDQIEQIRETLKNVVRDLNNLTDAAKQVERDKRAGDKEVETARAVLKKLQQVSL